LSRPETRRKDAARPGPGIDPSIAEYYRTSPEEERLAQGHSALERLRTQELIRRFAPEPPAIVADVGGAAGVYALWLSEAGYTVHLVDASERLVAEARRRSDLASRPLASCQVGDARALDLPDRSADLVLLLGPLYHLLDPRDRGRALAESRRVLKPGGWLFAAGISRWASALDGLARDLFQDPRFSSIVAEDLRSGEHHNQTERGEYFTTAYFHRPDDLRAEVERAGLRVQGVFGVEGPGWLFADSAERMGDERRRADLLRVAAAVESEPWVLGVSAHLLAVARKEGA